MEIFTFDASDEVNVIEVEGEIWSCCCHLSHILHIVLCINTLIKENYGNKKQFVKELFVVSNIRLLFSFIYMRGHVINQYDRVKTIVCVTPRAGNIVCVALKRIYTIIYIYPSI